MTPARVFHPPPGWPVEPGFTPGPDWVPDPSWPPAPDRWQFWVGTDRRGPSVAAVLAAIGMTGLLVATLIGVVTSRTTGAEPPEVKISNPVVEHGSSSTGVAPGWPPYSPEPFLDFEAWQAFGAANAEFNDNGRTAVLDTHDTTETGHTTWSGLISTRTTACAVRIVGRVRDLTHDAGQAGGFAIGLGELAPDALTHAALTGSAVQYDFRAGGFQAAVYPAGTVHGIGPDVLNEGWHDVDVTIDSRSHTLVVDGTPTLHTATGGGCGRPFTRVWAGATEFADFTVTPL